MKIINGKAISIGLALSGGGSRAIAFHLGCLKALHENGLLKNVDTISSVSGGSVISALYAYYDDSFDQFEEKTKTLLSKGLQWGIFFTAFKSWVGILILLNTLLFVLGESINLIIKLIFKILSMFFSSKFASLQSKLSFSIPRKFNRTILFEKYLEKRYFGEKKITCSVRNNMNVIYNACELRTGTALRFGNKESGCWRHGKIKDNIVKISTAVVASAAYPVLLPAIDRTWQIEDRQGAIKKTRLLLTDGGVYENLGVSPLEPRKDPKFSYNAFPSDFIICCNAGHGQFNHDNYPGWWAHRMMRAFSTVFKNVLNGYADKLHIYKENKIIYGFIYAYLGQIDNQLEFEVENLVPREKVIEYPTNFASMPEKEMETLIERGRQLTEGLIKHYYKELISI